MSLRVVPVTVKAAKLYVARWHRHHDPPQGGLWALGAVRDDVADLCGVAIVGRPVARSLQDGFTCEVIRLATDESRNACSFLYGAVRRAAQVLGYRRCITYTLARESGASLRGCGADAEW